MRGAEVWVDRSEPEDELRRLRLGRDGKTGKTASVYAPSARENVRF